MFTLIYSILTILKGWAIMNVTVLFTQGYISIKRGRVSRRYTPTIKSLDRLFHVLYYGPCNQHFTNRSTIHEWHGLSTLDDKSKNLLADYVIAVAKYNRLDAMLTVKANEKHTYSHLLPGYDSVIHNLYYAIGLKDACLTVGIHPVLVELVTPCQHGNARSICYTCATMM